MIPRSFPRSSAAQQGYASLARKRLYVSLYLGNDTSPPDLPHIQLQQPFCQPFGNRRPMHCTTTTPHPPPAGQPHHGGQLHHPHAAASRQPLDHHPPQVENSAWESCGRIVSQERADFWEFVACNAFFAAVALALLVVRSRRMQALQTRQLAARIGMVRGSARYG